MGGDRRLQNQPLPPRRRAHAARHADALPHRVAKLAHAAMLRVTDPSQRGPVAEGEFSSPHTTRAHPPLSEARLCACLLLL